MKAIILAVFGLTVFVAVTEAAYPLAWSCEFEGQTYESGEIVRDLGECWKCRCNKDETNPDDDGAIICVNEGTSDHCRHLGVGK